jgi:Protein of unknown function (DUF3800)
MPRCVIYLDESGDLGFSFNAPYRAGGSSRHLTVSGVVCPDDSKKYLKRFMVAFYRARGIPHGQERKWADLDAADRMDFANRAVALIRRQPQIRYASITVYKPRVQSHIQADPNKLYNYMVALFLVPSMRQFHEVSFVPDARSIKVKSGNSLHDYLQTKLWFDEQVPTTLKTHPSDSTKTLSLHFVDYLCGAFQSFHEDGQRAPRDALVAVTECRRLYFPP